MAEGQIQIEWGERSQEIGRQRGAEEHSGLGGRPSDLNKKPMLNQPTVSPELKSAFIRSQPQPEDLNIDRRCRVRPTCADRGH